MPLTSSKNWKTVRISDIGKIITGKTPSKNNPEDWGDLIPFITPTDIDDSSLYCAPKRSLSETGKRRFKNLLIPKHSICYTCIASVGKMCITLEDSVTNQQINSIVVNENIADYRFVFYLLRFFTPQILAAAGGTMTSIINKSRFEALEIPLPSLSEQREIAAILGSLDDKIELLRKENKTLESIAQTLFKEWFVDFRFPGATGKMVDSELGMIPEGWRVGTLRDICVNYDSKRIPLASDVRAKRKGKFPYYGATQIMDHIDDFIFDGDYLLLAEDASVMDEKGYPVLQYVEGKFWVSNHAHVLQGKNSYSTEMLYLLMRRTSVAGIVTGAVQLKINQENLFSLSTIIPSKEIANSFNKVIVPQFQRIKNNKKEIETLSKMRDKILNKIF